jgi:hypothetical protein
MDEQTQQLAPTEEPQDKLKKRNAAFLSDINKMV